MTLAKLVLLMGWLSLVAAPRPHFPSDDVPSSTDVEKLKEVVKSLVRQTLLQQFYSEERIRSEGDSGIKQMRMTKEGTRPYYASAAAGSSFAAIHNHANNIRTIGMGEVIAVINGVEFRTRHNDYGLRMPSTTSSEFHKVEDVPFPPVPPEVLEKPTVQEQIEEMREWFKAWRDDDISARDYRPYFKPVISYMEGAWTRSAHQVDESFFSDRHSIDAETWYELEETLRFLSYSGAKHTRENLSLLPKVIINMTEEGLPQFAQWNYRILTHPISFDLPLNRLRVVDDLKSRMVYRQSLEDFALSKTARFSLNAKNRNKFRDVSSYNWLLEEIMKEIPGTDNYVGNLTDHGFAGLALDPIHKTTLNSAFYHRLYSIAITDASGHQTRKRSFVDQNLFMAMTSQEDILGMENMKCATDDACNTKEQKWTYAFPLEIIYLTPLNSWNPYNIEFHADADTVTAGGRDGSQAKPFDGSHRRFYFLTPSEFFDGNEVNPDPADTSPVNAVHVLDKDGVTRSVTSSGIRILFPTIQGVGHLRQRYPIAPIHGEGAGVWKELEALQDLVLRPQSYQFMFYESFQGDTGPPGEDPDSGTLVLYTGFSTFVGVTPHYHTLELDQIQTDLLMNGETVTVLSSTQESHTHVFVLYFDDKDMLCGSQIKYMQCGGQDMCWDKHPHCIIQ